MSYTNYPAPLSRALQRLTLRQQFHVKVVFRTRGVNEALELALVFQEVNVRRGRGKEAA